MEDFQHDIVILLVSIKLLLILKSVLNQHITSALNHLVAHFDIKLVEVVQRLLELRILLLVTECFSFIDTAEDIQNLVNYIQAWLNQFQILMVVGYLAHTLQQLRKDLG